MGCLRLQTPEISHFKLFYTRPNPHVGVPTYLWLQRLLLQVSRSWLDLSGYTCLSKFWSGFLSFNLSFLIYPREVIDFQFAQLFHAVRLEVMSSSLFTCQSCIVHSVLMQVYSALLLKEIKLVV